MSTPAALGGPSERPQRRRHRMARHPAELGSQTAIMDRGQTTPLDHIFIVCHNRTISSVSDVNNVGTSVSTRARARGVGPCGEGGTSHSTDDGVVRGADARVKAKEGVRLCLR
ncbi:hypothetical protein NDU88_004340 [Pleurodeles waltl]|uniref:Uncharacterized protein n=1 Tax=Pleurodeles waltl TaxID=8319 RepID=A0AAV7RHY0_PLEWA|nr:hypothetical protein NDU88_004340 [Pleurodeles waltl]